MHVLHTQHIKYLSFTGFINPWRKNCLLTCSQNKQGHIACIHLLACPLQGLLCASENIHSGHHQTWSSGPFPGMKWQLTICRHPLTTSCKAQGALAWVMWATPKALLWALLPSAHSLSLPIRWSLPMECCIVSSNTP